MRHLLASATHAFEDHVQHGQLAGAVLLVSRGDDTWVEAVGHFAPGGPAPMRRDTLFRIASMTKPIAAAVTLMLVEDGTLKLEEPIDRLLPELAEPRVLRTLASPLDDTVPATRSILVEDLLTMRMGTGAIMTPGDYPIRAAKAERDVGVNITLDAASADDWLARIGSLPLMDQPGQTWLYDTSMVALGALLERASGQSLGALFRDRLFIPLGMRDTGFSVPPAELHRLPPAYRFDAASRALVPIDPGGADSRYASEPPFASAAAGLISTVDDYHLFARMLLNGGTHSGTRLLSEDAIRRMHTDHIPSEQKARSPFGPGFWETFGWGYGTSVVLHPSPDTPRGNGWSGGYGTTAYWHHDTVAILLAQRLMDSPAPPDHFTTFWRHLHDDKLWS